MYRKEEYRGRADEELLEQLKQGDRNVADYLLEKYKNLVRKKARSMYLVGGDNDDLIQEGMIGLYKAIRDFNGEKNSFFSSFAELCITRQLYTAVQASLRKKHRPLNSYISFDESGADANREEEGGSLSILSSYQNPEELVLGKEKMELLRGEIDNTLSIFEKSVLGMYLDGLSYKEISVKLGKSQKSIDNAVQRIRKKLETMI